MRSDDTAASSLWRSIAAGGCAIVAFAALLVLIWYSATTLFLLFAGILFGVFLNALSELLKRLLGGSDVVRLAIVCVALLVVFAGVILLGGTTIASQASVLATTLKSQLGTVKDFLDQRGIDTSMLNLNALTSAENGAGSSARSLPSAGEIASNTSTLLGQSLKIIAGLFGALGNIFVVVFLGVLLAAQPSVYRQGVLSFMFKPYRSQAEAVIDDVGETLRRWLLGQLVLMTSLFVLVWIGLSIIGIPGALALGVQTGLLSFIPTVGTVIAGVIIVLASLGSGWPAIVSAFALYLVIQFLEANVLTPLIQRRAIEIPPATIFGSQILLGFLFGIWGIALALPLIATIKVVLRHLYAARETAPTV